MTCMIWASQPLKSKDMFCFSFLYFDKIKPLSSIKCMYEHVYSHKNSPYRLRKKSTSFRPATSILTTSMSYAQCTDGTRHILIGIGSDMMSMFSLSNQRQAISIDGNVVAIFSRLRNTIYHR